MRNPLRTVLTSLRLLLVSALVLNLAAAAPAGEKPVLVTVDNFIRAETDLYFGRFVEEKGLGRLGGSREVTPIDEQTVVRMNRDTIYLSGVFDLDAAPVTIELPDAGGRFTSMQVIDEDHYTLEVRYDAGRYTYARDRVGTRYIFALVRVLADPQDPADLETANVILDAIKVEQARTGSWQAPDWDAESQQKIRDALAQLGTVRGETDREMFGARGEVDPVLHLIGTATGWGGNPRSAAVYVGATPEKNDETMPHELTVKDVPVDGFWSISVYNREGFFERNDLDAYSLNNLTARPDPDGSFTIRFGGDPKSAPNYLPITPGWNYTVRLYRPRKEILDGTWRFPEAIPAK